MINVLRVIATLATFMAAALANTAHAALSYNMPVGVTEISREVYGLHMLIFWICVVIGILVFGVMIWSLVYHRKSRGHKAAQFHESTSVEIAWTVVPFVILIGMAIPAAGTLIKMEDTSDSDITIKATGYQWLWEYEYINEDVQFYSRMDNDSNAARQLDSGINPRDVENYLRDVDNRMIVPVDKKVRLLLTSNDVIHAWWVPELSGKKDAIPGYINEMWFRVDEPGVYRGQCAELCGRGHAYMPIVVEAVTQDEYDAWVAEQGGSDGGEQQVADASGAAGAGEAETATDATADSEEEAEASASDSEAESADSSQDKSAQDGSNQDASSQDESSEGDSNQSSAASAPAAEGDEAESDASGQAASQDAAEQSANDAANGNESLPQAAASNEQASDQKAKPAANGGMSKADLMAKGKKVYDTQCAACHQADGSGLSAAGFPAIKGGAVSTGPVKTHINQVFNGKNAMPPYKNTLNDEEIAGVITYERNAFGNETGDVVQPAQIKALR